MALCLMKRLQMAGNKPVVLIGGGTAYIGDPSGRSDLRSMMTPEIIKHNSECFKQQMQKFIEFGDDKAIMVNNADWLLQLNYVELLREWATAFRKQYAAGRMLQAAHGKRAVLPGIQLYDYAVLRLYYLFQHYGCNMQFGGDDQWSNMLGGTELIRRKLGKDAYAMTITLLLTSEGGKMGKTPRGGMARPG
jgi:tyrosyl-tRNA synthetase